MTDPSEIFNFLSATNDEPFIAMTDAEMDTLEQIKGALGGEVFQLDGLWVWEVKGAEAIKVMEALIPALEKNGSKNCLIRAKQGREMVANWHKRNN